MPRVRAIHESPVATANRRRQVGTYGGVALRQAKIIH